MVDFGASSPDIGVDEVEKRLGQPGFYVIDVNNAMRYERGHVPGALSLDAHAFADKDLPADKGATLVFYCAGPS